MWTFFVRKYILPVTSNVSSFLVFLSVADQARILREWFADHYPNTYLSNEVRLDLIERTGLRRDQVDNWLNLARCNKGRAVTIFEKLGRVSVFIFCNV